MVNGEIEVGIHDVKFSAKSGSDSGGDAAGELRGYQVTSATEVTA